MNRRPHVVKIGGSLLPQGPAPLRRWLAGASQATSGTPLVLIVGGGAAVEALRRLDAEAPLGEAVAHWLAIDLMAVNARVVAEWLGFDLVDGGLDTLEGVSGGAVVFDPGRFLRGVEPTLPGPRLPIGWSTTSDAIAARVAATLNAELTLLKSAPPPPGVGLRELAEAGYVDATFPQIAAQVSSVTFAALADSAAGGPPG